MERTRAAEIAFEVEERIYPLQAAQAAAYAFTDRAYARVETAGAGRLRVALALKNGADADARAALEGEFRNELLHQALRLKVSEANRKIREFIVTKALISAQPAAALAAAPGAAAADSCPDCASAPAAPPMDPELEKEIDRLLAVVEGESGASDPLGVAVPWEEKFKDGAKEGPS